MLASNWVRKKFAYKGLAQGFSREQTLMRKYLHLVIKVDQCAHCVDHFGFATINTSDLTRNSRAVFKFVCETVLKLTVEKCHLGSEK